ncbi:Nuclear transcription factor Y subunit B-2 [Erysiphe necator]|nr:Nuclear transcription factor Y subunit B-2 [Erysiphe necator]
MSRSSSCSRFSRSLGALSPSKPRNHHIADAQIHNKAIVARIMKIALPENAKIAKEAKECMQECVSEFIAFITSEASEKCQIEKRKTVNGEDILFAMTSLGFENYAETLKIYLSKYRETQTSRGENRPGSQGFVPNTVMETANTEVNLNTSADANVETDINTDANANMNVNSNI